MSAQEFDMNTLFRYLGGFAILLGMLPYIGSLTMSLFVNTVGSAAKALYYLGIILFIIAVLSYILKDELAAKLTFSISIIITALGILIAGKEVVTNEGYYYGSAVLFLVFGVVLFIYFYRYENAEKTLKSMFIILMGILYTLTIILYGKFIDYEFKEIFSYLMINIGDYAPQSLILGGAFGLIFGLLLLIYGIFDFMVEQSEVITRIKRIVWLLLIYTWILGFLFAVYIRPLAMLEFTFGGITIGTSESWFAVAYMYVIVVNIISIFYGILSVALFIHIISEYASKQ